MLEDRIVWNFIDDVETSFLRSDMKKPSELLKEKMYFYNNPENDSLKRVQAKVDKTKELMVNNFEKLLERGTRLENLQEVTSEIEEGSLTFLFDICRCKRI